jgi:hypothetical protein
MKRIYWILIVCFLLLIPFVLADVITQNFPVSSALAYNCTNFANNTRPQDNDYSTSSYSTNYPAYGICYWTWNRPSTYVSSQFIAKITDSSYPLMIVPSSCAGQIDNTLRFKAVVRQNDFFISTYLYCLNNTDWQQIGSGGSGQTNNNYFYEASLNITSNNASILNCSLSCPGQYCLFHDAMEYNTSFQSCGYSLEPQDNTLGPVNNAVYFQKYTELDMQKSIYPSSYFNSNYDTYTIDLRYPAGWATCGGNWPSSSGFVEHSLIYSDYTANLNKIAYDITFYADISTHQITGYALKPGNYLEDFCADCYDASKTAKIEIYSFNYETPTQKFFNQTSGQYQFYEPDSYSVFINGVPLAYDLPLANPLTAGNSNLVSATDYYMSNCTSASAFDISGNLNQVPINQTTNTKSYTWAYCTSDSDCVSGFCSGGKCSPKNGGSSCSQNLECLSNLCNNGVCSDASFWTSIDATKTSFFGNDEATNDFISLLISFVVFVAIFGAAIYLNMMGAGLVIGGAAFMALSIFFTIVSWLSPFIIFGEFLIIAVVVFLAWLSGSRGG